MIKDNEKLHCLKILKESINNIINEELTISDELKSCVYDAIERIKKDSIYRNSFVLNIDSASLKKVLYFAKSVNGRYLLIIGGSIFTK